MKKVLITGASGTIGKHLIKYLLTEGKYSITALDVDNHKTHKVLKKYKKKIKVLYGDVLDRNLIEEIIKDIDFVVHLAGGEAPMIEMKKELGQVLDYKSTENISRAISYYNPECKLIYPSTTSLYDSANSPTVRSKIVGKNSFYNEIKIKCEKLIKSKVKNYSVLRISLILGDIKNDPFIYSYKKDSILNTITNETAAYSIVRVMDKFNFYKNKTLNIGGDSSFNLSGKDLDKLILTNFGLTFNFLFSKLFFEKKFTSPICSDFSKFEKELNYQKDCLSDYENLLKKNNKSRRISKLLGGLYIKVRLK